MDAPIFGVLWTTLRTIFYSEPWFEWLIPTAAAVVALYWLFIILYRTSVSRSWKTFMTFLFMFTVAVLFNIPNFYEKMKAGSPDKNCPDTTINRLTKEMEPVKYDYMWHHSVPGPADSGFVDLFLKQHEIFGMDKNTQNSHVCRLPYDEETKKFLQNLKTALGKQLEGAKKAGVPGERANEFGNIEITLPGSAESRAKMKSLMKSNKKKGEEDRDESFGHAEFKVPERSNAPKTEGQQPIVP